MIDMHRQTSRLHSCRRENSSANDAHHASLMQASEAHLGLEKTDNRLMAGSSAEKSFDPGDG